MGMNKGVALLGVMACCVLCSGCISLQKDLVSSLQADNERLYHELADAERRIADMALAAKDADMYSAGLQQEVDRLNQQIDTLRGQVQKKAAQAADILGRKQSLEQELRAELSQYQAKLEQTEKGLVVTFLAEILFDSGKAELKPESLEGLQKVADILRTRVQERKVAVEGHTDNEPIFHSTWASNWELSAARSLSVLHFFVEECKVDPRRLSAIAHGEFSPQVGNDTEAGKRQNRRVEIVILPPLTRQGA